MSLACAVLHNGVLLPAIGFGTKCLGDPRGDLRCALQTGYRLCDMAASYGNEAEIAKALEYPSVGEYYDTDLPKPRGLNKFKSVSCADFYANFAHPHGKDSKTRNRKAFITAKVGPSDMRDVESVIAAVNNHLKAIGRKIEDLMLLEWPGVADPDETPEKNQMYRRTAWQGLERVYAEGKVRAIGVSNFMENHLEQLIEDVKLRQASGDKFATLPMVNQVEINVYCQRHDGVLHRLCEEHAIVMMAHTPLGGPAGYEKMSKDITLLQMCKAHRVPVATLCLRYLLQRGYVVVPKSTRYEAMRGNCEAAFRPELNDEEMAMIAALDRATPSARDPKDV